MQAGQPSPLLPGISHFLIQVFGEQRESLMDFAIEQGYGVDVSDFISQHLLDDAPRCAEMVRWYQEHLPRVAGRVTFHGALWDLVPSSRDSKVRGATMERMRQCLDIAEQLGVTHLTFHLDFLPLARDPSYFPRWAERQASFWRELIEGRSVTVFLENIWEPRPEVVSRGVDAVGLQSVGACLDAAHVHLNSKQSQRQWVKELGNRIRCLHVSDNDRSRSQHLPPGQGTIDWEDLLGALVSQGLSLPTVIEVPGVAGVEASIEYLRSLSAAPQTPSTKERRPKK